MAIKKIIGKPKGFNTKFSLKPGEDKEVTHYCPGCGHGRVHKLVAEAMEELEIADNTISSSGHSCKKIKARIYCCELPR